MSTFRPGPSWLTRPGRLSGRATPRRLHPLVGALAVASVAVAGCGAGSTDSATGPGPTPTSTAPASPDAGPNTGPNTVPAPSVADPSPAPAPGRSALPNLMVNDVGAGGKVDLATLSPGPQPLLVWFWAPH